MMEHNKPFQSFHRKLEAKGIAYRCLWSAEAGVSISEKGNYREHRKGQHDVFLLGFYDMEGKPLPLAVVVDYGDRDGYGFYLQTPTSDIDKDIELIANRWHPESSDG